MLITSDSVKSNGNGQATITSQKIYEDIWEEGEAQPSYSSIEKSIDIIKIPSFTNYGIEKRSQTARSIVRTFYTKKIYKSLEWLSKNHQTPIESIHYIQLLLDNLKKYKDNYFEDPYSSFVSALYDALVFNDSWMNLRKEQFAKLIQIITPLNNNPNLNYDMVDKAINKFEKLGLDSTPF